jgi:hypothetical protein
VSRLHRTLSGGPLAHRRDRGLTVAAERHLMKWLCVAACVVLNTNCGRFNFEKIYTDGGSDSEMACLTSRNHDEDHDGIDDGCDNCPHMSNAGQGNLDNDGLGDICDPSPNVNGDQILLFEASPGADPRWDLTSQWSVIGDNSVLTGNGFLSVPVTNAAIEIAGTLLGNPSGLQQLNLGINQLVPAGKLSLYVEAYDNSPSSMPRVTVQHEINGSYLPGDSRSLGARLGTGDFRMQFYVDTRSGEVAGDFDFAGRSISVNAVVDDRAAGTQQIHLFAGGLQAQLSYFIVITSP